MRILMAGASGFLGSLLRSHLTAAGHEITQLVRGEATSTDQVTWDPYQQGLDPAVVADADAVINLAGAPIAHWPVTSSQKETILRSRTATSGLLSDTIAALDHKPALINASGISIYGDRGDEFLDEDSAPGHTFLAGVAQRWEEATTSARDAGGRVVNLRTSVVLDRRATAMQLMMLPFRVGLGGRLGSGDQYIPTISLRDYIAAVTRLTTDDSLSGPFNVVAPIPATNAEFTEVLAAAMHRPSFVPVPAFAIKTLAGDLSSEVLGSVRASPRALSEAGFTFSDPSITDQVATALAP